MYFALATVPGSPDRANEDWIGAAGDTVVVLDGVSAPADDTGCEHGTPWYVNALGMRLLAAAAEPGMALRDCLAASIKQVADLHPQCNLTDGATPSATVAVVRAQAGLLDYLVLSDAAVVLDQGETLQVVSDDRVESVASTQRAIAHRLPTGSDEHQEAVADLITEQRRWRNRPGGYWLAAADPAVTEHALAGSVEQASVKRLALLSDGAARLVSFGSATWCELLDLLQASGPYDLIQQVRKLEAGDPAGERFPRYKQRDDATVAYVEWGGDQ